MTADRCPTCWSDRPEEVGAVEVRPAGYAHDDDLAEYVPCDNADFHSPTPPADVALEEARARMAADSHLIEEVKRGMVWNSLNRLIAAERADAARQAREDSPDRDWRRSMEAYGLDSVAKTLDIMAEKVRQARAEVAERVHVAGCECGTTDVIDKTSGPWFDSRCLAERERVKEGK